MNYPNDRELRYLIMIENLRAALEGCLGMIRIECAHINSDAWIKASHLIQEVLDENNPKETADKVMPCSD
jgi:hypothetical protein